MTTETAEAIVKILAVATIVKETEVAVEAEADKVVVQAEAVNTETIEILKRDIEISSIFY
jgi:hypothetical protein